MPRTPAAQHLIRDPKQAKQNQKDFGILVEIFIPIIAEYLDIQDIMEPIDLNIDTARFITECLIASLSELFRQSKEVKS